MQLTQTEVDRLAESARASWDGSGSTRSSCPRGATARCSAWSRSWSASTSRCSTRSWTASTRRRWPRCSPIPAIEIVLHAGRQDVAILRREWQTTFTNVFDTQVAAGFAGFSAQAGYNGLLHDVLRIRLPKTASFTRWDARPLTDGAGPLRARRRRAPAAAGRRHPASGWSTRGRLEWAREECVAIAEATDERDPDEVWRRLPRVSGLDPRERAVAQALAGWRERTAAREDRPVGAILRDPTRGRAGQAPARRPPRPRADPRHHARRRAPPRRRRDGGDRARPRGRADQARGGRPLADRGRRRPDDRARRVARALARAGGRAGLRADRRARGPLAGRGRRPPRPGRAGRAHAAGLAPRARRRRSCSSCSPAGARSASAPAAASRSPRPEALEHGVEDARRGRRSPPTSPPAMISAVDRTGRPSGRWRARGRRRRGSRRAPARARRSSRTTRAPRLDEVLVEQRVHLGVAGDLGRAAAASASARRCAPRRRATVCAVAAKSPAQRAGVGQRDVGVEVHDRRRARAPPWSRSGGRASPCRRRRARAPAPSSARGSRPRRAARARRCRIASSASASAAARAAAPRAAPRSRSCAATALRAAGRAARPPRGARSRAGQEDERDQRAGERDGGGDERRGVHAATRTRPARRGEPLVAEPLATASAPPSESCASRAVRAGR